MRMLLRLAMAVGIIGGLGSAAMADDYTIDPMHSSVSFKILHAGVSYVHGRFNSFSGKFTVDSSDPTKTSFTLNIKPETIDTNNGGRDTHLRSPDFFNVKQFPTISFKSTSVKPVEGGYEVTGELSIHGSANPITLILKGGRSTVMQGIQRTGYVSDFVVKRSDFGVGKPGSMLGDEVYVSIGLEGTKK
jgi:polyisoprenoid-binding protein YceI